MTTGTHSGMPLFTPGLKSGNRPWVRLTILWALYYLAIYSIGLNKLYTQRVIWGGAVLVGAFSLPVFFRYGRRADLPLEGILLILFSLWASTGFFFATDYDMFYVFFRQIVELALIVLFVSFILKHSAGAKWFYLAYIGVVVYHVFFREESISLDQLQMQGRIASANTYGFNCFLGLLSVLALFGETKKTWVRGVLFCAGMLALFGVVLSASRSAFVASSLLVALWAPLCLLGSARQKIAALLGAVIVLYAGQWVFQAIVQNTYMGTRFTQAVNLEDGSTVSRLEFVGIGGQLFLENPIFGCGIGQFGVASGTGYYAHNEVVEIAATTGLPGLILYYSAFILAWKRLSGSLRFLDDSYLKYRVNSARLAMITLLLSGALSRPNFLTQNTMFLLGVVVGVAHWAQQVAHLARCRTGSPRATRESCLMAMPPNVFSRLPCIAVHE